MSIRSRRAAIEKRLSPGLPTRLALVGRRMWRFLRMELWFPHVPLALAVGLVGLDQLLPSFGAVQGFISALAVPPGMDRGLAPDFRLVSMRGVSKEVVGLLLILSSVGLLGRWRLAWMVTVSMTLVTLGLQVAPTTHLDLPYLTWGSALLLALLLLAREQFQRTNLTSGTLFAIFANLLTAGYGVLGCYALGADFRPAIRDFTTALYFTVATMSTVGYGDITPQTSEAKLFTISLVVLGLVVFATSLSVVLGPLIRSRLLGLLQPKEVRMERKNHIIIVGDNSLARNALRALSDRGIPVTAIWPARPPEGTEPPADLVVGDGRDDKVLRCAGVEQARAVLALSEDDASNAFVALAAKDVNDKVRTVVAVSDSHSMNRLSHVHPDAVLALPVIGGELLAMALSGEEIKTDVLVDQLLKLG